jgi:uncharacterized caspase-like protein
MDVPWNRLPHARLLTRLIAAVLVLFLAAIGIVKGSSVLESHRAKVETSPSRVVVADLATAQASTPVARTLPVGEAVRSVALVIGNARYPDDGTQARQAVDDARAMADEMRGRGFNVTLGEDLTRQGMLDAFSKFASTVEPGATALIFFSGYGIQSERQTYLIPVNAEIWREADVRRDGVALDTVLADLDAHGAATKLVVIDGSRRNPFEWRFRGASTGLAPIKAPKGTLVIYSAAPGQVIHDDETSLFVGALINQMRRDGASVEDAFNRTRIMVARASHDEQVPGVFSSLTTDLSLPPASTAATHETAR